ncbi:hypothetical protein PENSPDRAFT_671646 [Peniophora sp. CONT]|nr:hypothetical protein PENSPDRAFT_671646 [Peniophora sp. CONT]
MPSARTKPLLLPRRAFALPFTAILRNNHAVPESTLAVSRAGEAEYPSWYSPHLPAFWSAGSTEIWSGRDAVDAGSARAAVLCATRPSLGFTATPTTTSTSRISVVCLARAALSFDLAFEGWKICLGVVIGDWRWAAHRLWALVVRYLRRGPAKCRLQSSPSQGAGAAVIVVLIFHLLRLDGSGTSKQKPP